MELRNIYELWERFDTSVAEEMSLSMNGVSFTLKKRTGVAMQDAPAAPVIVSNPAEPGKEAEKKEQSGVSAPLVGTFYRAASPDAEPFVTVGAQVQVGDVVGIIEAMKLMNEVRSTVSGVVKEIPAGDGDMVEYGQMLVVVE